MVHQEYCEFYVDIVECENDCRCSNELAGRFRIGAIGIRRGVGAPTIYQKKLNLNRCHEAILIHALVEADAERQVIEKTEFLSEKTRVVKIDDDPPIRAKTVSMLLSLDKAAVVMELDEQPIKN